MTDASLINAQLDADAAWEYAQQLKAENDRLTNQVSQHRKSDMRQFYGMQGFMAIKAIVDRYNAHIGPEEQARDVVGRIYATILEHKGHMDRADAP